MSQRRHVAVIAGLATVLAAVPLSVIFATLGWLFYGVLAVAAVVGAATGARAARFPVTAQAAVMVVALGLLLSWLFPSGREYLGFVPNLETLRHFGDLLGGSVDDMRKLSVPVPERESLTFLTTVGIGGVAIVVDVLVMGLGHPALAGLPMLAIYSVPVAVRAEGVPWLPFVIGAVGYLWLLMTDNIDRVRRWGRRFSGDGRDIDSWEPSPLAAAGRRVGFAGIILAILIPVAVPGMSVSLFERYYTGTGPGDGSGGPGTSQLVNPVALLANNLQNPDTSDVLRIETDNPSPLYLRLAVADQVTPAGFSPRRERERRPLSDGLGSPADVVTRAQSHTYRAEVTMADYNLQYLPLYAHPTRIAGVRGTWFYNQADSTVWSSRPNLNKAKFTFEYSAFTYEARQLRQARPLPDDDAIRQAHTRLPGLSTANTRFINNLVGQLTAGKGNDYDKTMAVLNYFSRENGFRYSLETKSGTSGAAIVDFLTHKQGFCQQYAAAMAWMLRAAGLPARLVIGLSQGTQSANRWTMTNQDFHAWVEVYFDDFGWVPFDPTPAVPNATSLTWAPRPDDLPDPGASATPGPGGTAGTDPEDLPDRERLAGDEAVTAVDKSGGDAPSRWPVAVLLGVVAIAALLMAPAAQRTRITRYRRRHHARASHRGDGDPAVLPLTPDTNFREASHAVWDELMDTMVDLRLPVDHAESPRATTRRLARGSRLPEPVRASLTTLAKAEERARYARTVDDTPDLFADLTRVRGHLAGTVSRRTRILAALLPPSVLRRWHGHYSGMMNRASASLLRWREAVSRVVTPRRLFAGRFGR